MKNTLTRLPAKCHARLGQWQDAWIRKRDKQCNREADEETGGSGSMRPMIYSSCRTGATQHRVKIVEAIGICKEIR